MSTNQTFKAFKGGKSKARKGLERYAPELFNNTIDCDQFLSEVDGQWGFDTEKVELYLAEHMGDKNDADINQVHAGNVDLPTGSESDAGAASDDSDADDEAQLVTASPNMFGGIAATLGSVAVVKPEPAARTGATRSNYTIEKDRPEQNGIKRPSAGGLCRAVWDKMDEIRTASGAVPTTAQVRSAAETEGWNTNNAMIEFYQWRKYNGITGRAVKAPPVEVVAPVVTAGAEAEATA